MVYPQMIPGKGQPAGSGSAGAGASGSGSGGGAGGGGGVNMIGTASGAGVGAGGGPERDRREPSAVGSVSTAAAAVKAEKFEARIFGFKVHEEARLGRWRSARRDG